MWEMLMAAGTILLLFMLMPKISSATILHRRVRRLEKKGVERLAVPPIPR